METGDILIVFMSTFLLFRKQLVMIQKQNMYYQMVKEADLWRKRNILMP